MDLDGANNFEFPKSKNNSKRNRSSTDTPDSKKSKPLFITANRFSPLSKDDSEIVHSQNALSTEDNPPSIDTQEEKKKLPPPIIVRGILDFFGIRNEIIKLIGADKFIFKSSTNELKIQTVDSDSYRKIIHFLSDSNAQYHTYQPQEDKAFRIVIRNLHPSTPTVEVGVAIEEIGFSVRQVSNVLHKTTKHKLPLFFVDLEPAEINKDIFGVTSLLHTKIKVEEPHKRKDVIKCLNCQDYGHSRKYCSYTPRCVRCGSNHPSSNCGKSRESPAKCALCEGDHPANYKGCRIYKDLQRFRKPTTSNNHTAHNNAKGRINNVNNNNCTVNQQQPPESHSLPRTYAHATSNQNPDKNHNDNCILTNFLSEFKSLINPLLSLLTTVLDRLLAQNDK